LMAPCQEFSAAALEKSYTVDHVHLPVR